MLESRIQISPPAPFDFYSTVYSHGWVDLAPTSWNSERQSVHRVEMLSRGVVVSLEILGNGSTQAPQVVIKVRHAQPVDDISRMEIADKVGWMLRLDEDLSDFYSLCQAKGGGWAALADGRGRLLRSSSLFEDVVKTICTTNIQWGGTKRMVSELVAAYGEPLTGDLNQKAFPTPQTILEDDFDMFAARVRLGYRAAYVYELAERSVKEAELFDARKAAGMEVGELRNFLLGIKGVGGYAAATLLMLLGHYGELAVDTEFREFMRQRCFVDGYPGDGPAQAVYSDWGCWKYLAYWFDNYGIE